MSVDSNKSPNPKPLLALCRIFRSVIENVLNPNERGWKRVPGLKVLVYGNFLVSKQPFVSLQSRDIDSAGHEEAAAQSTLCSVTDSR